MTSNLNMIDIINEPNDNINTKLDINEKEYLLKLFSEDKTTILELRNLIDDILQDNKINFHDIPNIILFITKKCANYFSIYKYNVDATNIIKFITEAIIHTHINSLTSDDIVIINNVIDISLELLRMNLTDFNKCTLLCKWPC